MLARVLYACYWQILPVHQQVLLPCHCMVLSALTAALNVLMCCRHSAMVQLSVLLCLIPLALENAMMQAHITQVSSRQAGTCCWYSKLCGWQ